MNQEIHIRRLDADEPAFEIIARWRYDAFFAQDGGSFEESRDALHAWMHGLGYETALLAEVDGKPAGSCLFVREEIDPKHDLTPWLAALYVAPEFRKQGIASALVRAIEQHARDVGCGELYLYTVTAEPLYAKLGWTARERFNSNGEKFVLMARALSPTRLSVPSCQGLALASTSFVERDGVRCRQTRGWPCQARHDESIECGTLSSAS